MYQVRSPGSEWMYCDRFGSVTYCCSTVAGGVSANDPSSSPAWIFWKMSSTLELISTCNPSR